MPRFNYEICTVQDGKICKSCQLQNQLKCRFNQRWLINFMIRAILFIIPAGIGLVLADSLWALLAWIAFMLIFFTLWEIRILCNHCPFYAEDAPILHCIANYGSPKVWKYHPEPMTLIEKVQLLIGFVIFGAWPIPWLILGGRYFFTAAAAITLVIFFHYLIYRVCTTCVNFSCPLNRVPKAIVDRYLRKNEVMRTAWEDSGYELDPLQD
ncbi:MAG: hypothetical protein K8R40_01255 [Anaerolineaceae bacterium]|nr:hypothetical protein [Anaerolineaceae bacterium]